MLLRFTLVCSIASIPSAAPPPPGSICARGEPCCGAGSEAQGDAALWTCTERVYKSLSSLSKGVAALWRCRARGYKNLYSLEGGVARYLKEEGPSLWKGHLFVFDARLAVPPEDYSAEAGGGGRARGESIVRCTLCAGELEQVRHRNCANAACNALILSVGSPGSSQLACTPLGTHRSRGALWCGGTPVVCFCSCPCPHATWLL